MLGDDGQAKPASDAVPRRGATGKALENSQSFAHADSGPVVVDDEQKVSGVVTADENLGGTSGVVSRIVEQVEENALHPSTVQVDDVVVAEVGYDENGGVSVTTGDSFH